jgi:hypothetical protein
MSPIWSIFAEKSDVPTPRVRYEIDLEKGIEKGL